ncbi:MAG: lysophospholipase [Oscillospiraceae bacterium]|nr:lysophospholipase [Oscillospiraceae bacterium]
MSWEHIKIPNGETSIFCNVHIKSKTAMNIIVTHTPIVTTVEMEQAYKPFEKYDVNVFAFDFSGTGKSDGNPKAFSRKSFVTDLDVLTTYIERNYSLNIHLYGNTGIGGMIAQYYATTSEKVISFAQFSCINYKDTAGGLNGFPYFIAKALCLVLKILPEIKISLNPPKYQGYRHEEDNAFYENLEKKYPHLWKTSTKGMLQTLLELFVAKDSAVKNSVAIPTLVFKVLHDRYFDPEYFDKYYQSLTCKKKIIEINGVHNSYYLDSELFCKHVYEWFMEHSS